MSLAGQYSETFDRLWQWYRWSRTGGVDLTFPHSQSFAGMIDGVSGASTPDICDDEALIIDGYVASFLRSFDDDGRILMAYLSAGCNVSAITRHLGVSRERVNQALAFSIGHLGALIFQGDE